jgi:hydrogenase maturation protein HypF
MIDRGVNAPWTSSLGRLFDGVAALLLGLGRVGYDGEAAMRLEAAAAGGGSATDVIPTRVPGPADHVPGDRAVPRGDWRPLVDALWRDAGRSDRADRLAGRFHDAVAGWGVAVASQFPGRPVVLGGGCFQNRRLRETLTRGLRRAGRTVLAAARVPPGDGGLAAGQLAVAAARLAGRS